MEVISVMDPNKLKDLKEIRDSLVEYQIIRKGMLRKEKVSVENQAKLMRDADEVRIKIRFITYIYNLILVTNDMVKENKIQKIVKSIEDDKEYFTKNIFNKNIRKYLKHIGDLVSIELTIIRYFELAEGIKFTTNKTKSSQELPYLSREVNPQTMLDLVYEDDRGYIMINNQPMVKVKKLSDDEYEVVEVRNVKKD